MSHFPKPCKDCLEIWNKAVLAGENPKPFRQRPATPPGPRCATHHRENKQRQKAEAHERRVVDTYGLGPGEYAQLYEFQGGVCAICKRATGATRKLSVDHSHATGAVRGLLCRTCNDLLGHARDDKEFFVRCINYLAHTPYSQWKRTDGTDPQSP